MKATGLFCLLLVPAFLAAQDSVTLQIGNQSLTFQKNPTPTVLRITRAARQEVSGNSRFAARFDTFGAANPATGALAFRKLAERSELVERTAAPESWERSATQQLLTSKLNAEGDLAALFPELIVQFTAAADDTQARNLLRIYGASSVSATEIPGRYLVSMPNTGATVNAAQNMKEKATIPSKDGSGRLHVVDYATPNLYYIRPSLARAVARSSVPLHARTAAVAPAAAQPPPPPAAALGPAAGIDWASTISDPLFPNQWPLAALMATPPTELGVLHAWKAFGWQGENIKVAVIDDGVDLQHEDLKDAIADYWDTTAPLPANNAHQNPYVLQDNAVHGTLCAGLIAAQINGKGIVGIAPKARILAIKAASYGDYNGVKAWVQDDIALADAIDRARLMGADIINASWGMTYDNPDIKAAITRVGSADHRTLLVFAAGDLRNSDPQQSYEMFYPAQYSSDTTLSLKNAAIIAVGATTPCDSLKTYASCDKENNWAGKYEPSMTVAAPGTSMPSTLPGNQYYDQFNGTSASAPIVTGVVALLLSKEPGLSAQDVFKRVTTLSHKIGAVQNQDVRRIDAYCILQNPPGGCP